MSRKECRYHYNTGESRYKFVKRGLFWRIKIGTGTRLVGRFFRKISAMRMCAELSTAYEDGRFSVEHTALNTAAIQGAWIRCPKCGANREISFQVAYFPKEPA